MQFTISESSKFMRRMATNSISLAQFHIDWVSGAGRLSRQHLEHPSTGYKVPTGGLEKEVHRRTLSPLPIRARLHQQESQDLAFPYADRQGGASGAGNERSHAASLRIPSTSPTSSSRISHRIRAKPRTQIGRNQYVPPARFHPLPSSRSRAIAFARPSIPSPHILTLLRPYLRGFLTDSL